VKPIKVWSNGRTIRRYSGQGEQSIWRNPKDGYRQMYALLLTPEQMERINEWVRFLQMCDQANDNTRCPKCNGQLYWCACVHNDAVDILADILEV
jgi:uncharacterized protein with PIN domain